MLIRVLKLLELTLHFDEFNFQLGNEALEPIAIIVLARCVVQEFNGQIGKLLVDLAAVVI